MKLSQIIDQYKSSGDRIKGGKGDNPEFDKIDKKELAVGILVEKEHSSDLMDSVAVALDHLTENPKYYTELLASGIVDEKEALDLAKKFGWTIGESIVRRVIRKEIKSYMNKR